MAFPDNDASSAQYAQMISPDHDPLRANELGGRVRHAYFRIESTGASQVDGYTWYLTKLPKGARLLEGVCYVWNNPGSNDFEFNLVNAAGSADVMIERGDSSAQEYTQTYGSVTLGRAVTSTGGPGRYPFNNEPDSNRRGFGIVLREEAILTMSVDTASLSSAVTVWGNIQYVVD